MCPVSEAQQFLPILQISVITSRFSCMLCLNNFGSTSMTDDLSFSPKTSKLSSLMIMFQSCLMWRREKGKRKIFFLRINLSPQNVYKHVVESWTGITHSSENLTSRILTIMCNNTQTLQSFHQNFYLDSCLRLLQQTITSRETACTREWQTVCYSTDLAIDGTVSLADNAQKNIFILLILRVLRKTASLHIINMVL